jgi:methyl-accepting chemotaxis protein
VNSAIREVSQCATDAVSVGQKAVKLASEATVTMSQLSESSAGIGNVLKVITSIAEQTNLLALNATIEAARAGDAGKGFAVVANEVKELAKETAKATDEISVRISTIQNDASNAGNVIEQIATIIEQIGDFQKIVANAVNAQTATTREISNSIGVTSVESSAIEQRLTEIASKASQTNESARAVNASATALSDIASQLSELISVYQIQKTPA